jgi:hypothetical protein
MTHGGVTQKCMPHQRNLPVVPLCRGPLQLISPPNQWLSSLVSFPQEGRLAIVTDVGNAMRWTHIAERNHCATNGVCSDGEVVWSWRSDAGAKVVKTLRRLAGDGGNQARSPKSTKDTVKTIVQGMRAAGSNGCCGVPLVANACAFLRTRGLGCNAHPAFPAPSFNSRAARFQQLGHSSARPKTRVGNRAVAILRDAAKTPLLRTRSFMWHELRPLW